MSQTLSLSSDELVRSVEEARIRTLELVDDLDTEQLTVPLMEAVNPFLWELGHVAFFFDVFLLRPLEESSPVMKGSDDLYNSFTVDHDDRWLLNLPSREETIDYMQQTSERVIRRFGSGKLRARETYLYQLAVRHEDMHAEAFTYMRQTLEFPAPKLSTGRGDPGSAGTGPHPGDVEVPGGTFRLGAEREAPFVFDNEKWSHPVTGAPFRISRAPVTNALFREFVEDKGYPPPAPATTPRPSAFAPLQQTIWALGLT